MVGAEIFVSGLGGLSIRVKRCLILLEELLLNSYIVIGNTKHGQSVLRLFDRFPCLLLLDNFGNKLVLDEDQGLHGMLQGQLVLAHLTENSTDV